MKTKKFFQENASDISPLGYTKFEDTFLLLKLLEESPLAWEILQYAAYLDPDFIDVNIFKELLLVDEEKLQKPIKSLEELSLISIWHQNGIDGLQLHRLVQDSVKNYIKRHKEKLKKLEAINSIYKNDVDALPLKKLLQDSVHKGNVVEEKEIYARIVSVLDDLFPWLPNVPNLDQENSKPLLNYWKQSKICYFHILKILDNNIEYEKQDIVANLYQKLGDYNSIFRTNFEQSFKYYEKALKIKKELYQGNHSYIALSLDKVGENYQKSGDINKAIEFYKQAYLMYVNNLGADHPTSQNLKTYLEKISLEFTGNIEA